MIRNIGVAVLALIAFFLCVMLGDYASSTMFPSAAGADFSTKEGIRAFMDSVPVSAFLVMMLGHALGSLLAGSLVARFTRDKQGQQGSIATAAIVGIMLTAGGVANLAMIPHPTWFWSDAAIYPVFVFLGYMAGRKK